MNIDSINNGVVIDHITAGLGMKLYELLKLDTLDASVAIIKNVTSKKMGKKDIIKIDSDAAFALPVEVLGVISRNITVVTVKEGEIESKKHVSLPLEISDFLRCKNPRCITSTEQGIHHRFRLSSEKDGVYRCVYCDTKRA